MNQDKFTLAVIITVIAVFIIVGIISVFSVRGPTQVAGQAMFLESTNLEFFDYINICTNNMFNSCVKLKNTCDNIRTNIDCNEGLNMCNVLCLIS